MQSIKQFLSDEQDESAVRKILPKVSELLTKDETVEYIAVQKKLVVNLSPDAIVLTNKRFILVQPSMFGMKFQDFPWREVDNVHMSEQMLGATLTCKTTTGKTVALESLPKKQARRVYSYAQQIEEQAYEKRQQVELEKMRASAGGVVLHAPVAAQLPAAAAIPAEDPLAALAQLKRLLDAELITPEEFAGKKAEILARL
ncbi:PH domain-containing protein [Luteimonas sp. A534]